jgi:hypothetical protein
MATFNDAFFNCEYDAFGSQINTSDRNLDFENEVCQICGSTVAIGEFNASSWAKAV